MNLDDVTFDMTGLTLSAVTTRGQRWITTDGQQAVVKQIMKEPGPPSDYATPANLAALRQSVLEKKLAVIEFDSRTLGTRSAIRMITKGIVDPETGRGRYYNGTLVISVSENRSIRIWTQAGESAMTGMREAIMIDRLRATDVVRFREPTPEEMAQGQIFFGAGDLVGWVVDPTDPAPPNLTMNVSEDQRYDADFPDHPLSRVRAMLDRIERSLQIPDDTAKGSASDSKPWWQFWQ